MKSNNIRMVAALSINLCKQRNYVIFQQYFTKRCENNVMFERPRLI